MTTVHLGRICTCVFVAAILSVFFWPAAAAADSMDVVTLTFAGSGSCVVLFPPTSCGSGTTVVGSYSFDPDAGSIVGPWSFVTPFGTFSSSDTGAYSAVGESESFPPAPGGIPWPAGYDDLGFVTNAGGVSLGFADPQDYYGPVATPVQVQNITFVFSLVFQANGTTPTAIFDITSGTATPTLAPEPSSLLLLAVGLLGLPLLQRGLRTPRPV